MFRLALEYIIYYNNNVILEGIVFIQDPRAFDNGPTVLITARAIARAVMRTGGPLSNARGILNEHNARQNHIITIIITFHS